MSQQIREMVGADVMATLDEFRRGGGNMMQINKSHLFSQLKCHGAKRIEDFILISLSNSIYLIIAKVLVNRLRTRIRELI